MKVKKLILTICSIVILGLIIFYIPKNVNVEHEGIKYGVSDTSHVEKTNIKIKGKLHKRLFKEDKFVGTFEVDGYEFTKTYDLIDIVLPHKFKGKRFSYLSYTSIKEGSPVIESLGYLSIEGNFKKINILAFEPLDTGKKVSKSIFICAPAKSLEDALKITEEFENYKNYIKDAKYFQ